MINRNYTNDENKDLEKTPEANMLGCLVDTCKTIGLIALVGFCAYLFYAKGADKTDTNTESKSKTVNVKDTLVPRNTTNVIQYNQQNVKSSQR